MQKLACLLLLAVLSLYSADNIAGNWSGIMTVSAAGGQTQDVGMAMILQQKGSELTGSFTPTGKAPIQIQKGKVEGDKVTFEIQDVNPSLKFDGTLSGGILKFKVEGTVKVGAEERQFKGTMDLKREE